MRILQVQRAENLNSGQFAAIIEAGDLGGGGIIDYGLCQICRIVENGNVINNPMASWLDANGALEAREQIKGATLNLGTGWFVDHFYQNEAQAFSYFMASFDADTLDVILHQIFDQFESAISYGEHNILDVLQPAYQNDYFPHLVPTGQGIGGIQYPVLYDSPAQPLGNMLQFEVHLIVRRLGPGNVHQMEIGHGFTWTWLNNEAPPPPIIYVAQSSQEFQSRVLVLRDFMNNHHAEGDQIQWFVGA